MQRPNMSSPLYEMDSAEFRERDAVLRVDTRYVMVANTVEDIVNGT